MWWGEGPVQARSRRRGSRRSGGRGVPSASLGKGSAASNLNFADWIQVFGDEKLTAALLDRFTHHAHIIELVGGYFRFRQRMKEWDDEEYVAFWDSSRAER